MDRWSPRPSSRRGRDLAPDGEALQGDSFTPAERRLAELGEHQRLRDTRLYFQHATERNFFEVVEGTLHRLVRAFISGVDTHRDVATEVFYLEPRGNGVPPA